MLILSLFPGIDLFSRPFEARGHCVVRGPELFLGQDIRTWPSPPAGRFDGIIGGPPCQKYSQARSGKGSPWDGIPEFLRVVRDCRPAWWVAENVVGAERSRDFQRSGAIPVRTTDWDCGGLTKRRRTFFFFPVDLGMLAIRCQCKRAGIKRAAYSVMASSARRTKQGLDQYLLRAPEAAKRQGYPELAKIRYRAERGFSHDFRVHLLGNGVPRAMGEWVALVVDLWIAENRKPGTNNQGPQ